MNEIEDNDTPCSICWEEPAQVPIRLPCNHIFCKECLLEWFKKADNCPMCHGQGRVFEIYHRNTVHFVKAWVLLVSEIDFSSSYADCHRPKRAFNRAEGFCLLYPIQWAVGNVPMSISRFGLQSRTRGCHIMATGLGTLSIRLHTDDSYCLIRP